jgi:hypothetical protein
VLQGYKDTMPESLDIIFGEYRRNSEHVRVTERELLEQQRIALENQLKIESRGQMLSFALALMLFGVLFVALYSGNTEFAGVSGLAFLVVMIKGFLAKK